jgi:hypothetical protein
VSTDTTGVFSEGNGSLVKDNVLEVVLGLNQGHALNGVRNLTAVLVVHADVRAAGLDGLSGVGGLGAALTSDKFNTSILYTIDIIVGIITCSGPSYEASLYLYFDLLICSPD